MSDKILSSIFEFLKNYKDPENNNRFDQQNPKIQVVEKSGNVLACIVACMHVYDIFQATL